jgi:hypothetical protein
MARGLLFLMITMQIPYDLEFVEKRPTVQVRAIALREPFPAWSNERSKDGFDALLAWVHRLLRRFEKN